MVETRFVMIFRTLLSQSVFFPFSPLLNGADLLIPLVEGFLNNFGFDFAPFFLQVDDAI